MSNLCEEAEEPVGMIFLKKIFDDTKTIAEPNAHNKPTALDADTSNEHASMTPSIRGSSDMYVLAEYRTPNKRAYAATVKRGESALMVCVVLTGIRDMAILEKM